MKQTRGATVHMNGAAFYGSSLFRRHGPYYDNITMVKEPRAKVERVMSLLFGSGYHEPDS